MGCGVCGGVGLYGVLGVGAGWQDGLGCILAGWGYLSSTGHMVLTQEHSEVRSQKY